MAVLYYIYFRFWIIFSLFLLLRCRCLFGVFSFLCMCAQLQPSVLLLLLLFVGSSMVADGGNGDVCVCLFSYFLFMRCRILSICEQEYRVIVNIYMRSRPARWYLCVVSTLDVSICSATRTNVSVRFAGKVDNSSLYGGETKRKTLLRIRTNSHNNKYIDTVLFYFRANFRKKSHARNQSTLWGERDTGAKNNSGRNSMNCFSSFTHSHITLGVALFAHILLVL